MNINYIILAHKEPNQLRRLVKKLSSANTYFYVHIDKNIEIAPFQEALKKIDNVTFLSYPKRVASIWGSPGLVKATLQAMKEIIQDQRSGYTILLSGQCYPIKSNEHITSFLQENEGYNFIEGFELPDYRWPSSNIRLHYYTFFLSARKEDFITAPSFFDHSLKSFFKRGTLKKYLKIVLNFPVRSMVLFKKRKFPNRLKPFGGMQWWALPNDTVKFILNYLDEHPEYINYHTYTLFSDEIFFQTLVHNFFKKIKSPTTFSTWSVDEANSSPLTLTTNHMDMIKERPELFARKFDYDIDQKVLDLIDQLNYKTQKQIAG